MNALRLRALAVGAGFATAVLSSAILTTMASAAPAPVQLTLEQAGGPARYGGTATLTASLQSGGSALTGKQLVLERAGTQVATAVTSASGKAGFKLGATASGSYDVRFTPAGPDAQAYQAATSAPVTVRVAPAITMQVSSRLKAGHKAIGVPGGPVQLHGKVRPFIAGQVVVRVTRHGRQVRRKTKAITQRGGSGRFRLRIRLPRRGRYVIRAETGATADLVAGSAPAKHLTVVLSHAGPGSRGPAVRALQRRLSAIGYPSAVTGEFGASTGRAVLAFRKVNGMARVTSANGAVFRKLAAGGGSFRVRYPKAGRHAEFDWSRQVLVLANGSRPVRVVPASSGKPSTPTVFGSFHFYRKSPGLNSHGMYYSSYFIGGYAVHGYAEVPTYAASHGCIRIPIPSAVSVYGWIRVGMKIFVYR